MSAAAGGRGRAGDAPAVGLVDYGAGNLRSVEFALDEVGASHRRVASGADLPAADRVVLPGVGAAASAMQELRARDLGRALRAFDGPILGICLGMQLLVESSDEGADAVECLGLLPGRTRRFRTSRPLPQMGWNQVGRSDDALFRGLDPEPHFYFLHGHRVECPPSLVTASAEYGGEAFPAAVRRGRAAGVQFHPEKSGRAGLQVLANFCFRGAAGTTAGRGAGSRERRSPAAEGEQG